MHCVDVLETRNASLLHIYFGHIAVHLLPLIRAWPTHCRGLLSWRRCDGGHGKAGVSRGDNENARGRPARAGSFGIVRHGVDRSWDVRRKKFAMQRTGIPVGDIPF